ncbi:MAG: PhzF family phenazine biosynthesis protein [Pseudomonadota bacterium]
MTRQIEYEVWDVFTEIPFRGNQLAVIPDAHGLSGAEMQTIAREFNYSESIFLLPAEAGGTIRARIFTPASEIPFAGHPTVGATASLANAGYAFGNPIPTEMIIEEGIGPIACHAALSNGAWHAGFTSHAPFEKGAIITAKEIAACLGLRSNAIRTTRHEPQAASKGLPFVFAEMASRGALAKATPVRAAFLKSQRNYEAHSRFFSVAAYYRRSENQIDMRVFVPLEGIDEDPATGSACAALAGFLADIAQASVAIEITQGADMGRESHIFAEANPPTAAGSEVSVSGAAVLVMSGMLHLPG